MVSAPTLYSSESASDKQKHTTSGTLPERQDTVRAAVLAAMLEGQFMTGMDSVFEQSTTRLSAVVYALERDYGWRIERRDVPVYTKDGRSTWITTYWLSAATRKQALAMGARVWINGVKIARAKRLQSAGKKKQGASAANAIRNQLRKQDPRQRSLWGDA